MQLELLDVRLKHLLRAKDGGGDVGAAVHAHHAVHHFSEALVVHDGELQLDAHLVAELQDAHVQRPVAALELEHGFLEEGGHCVEVGLADGPGAVHEEDEPQRPPGRVAHHVQQRGHLVRAWGDPRLRAAQRLALVEVEPFPAAGQLRRARGEPRRRAEPRREKLPPPRLVAGHLGKTVAGGAKQTELLRGEMPEQQVEHLLRKLKQRRVRRIATTLALVRHREQALLRGSSAGLLFGNFAVGLGAIERQRARRQRRQRSQLLQAKLWRGGRG
mmetsp:Transcript_10140/g.37119  ORF Transcript_10140/g.37119 Transcript_10140/m.37119 type:complete len:273 (+) Transcript_10140:660-1478(+)